MEKLDIFEIMLRVFSNITGESIAYKEDGRGHIWESPYGPTESDSLTMHEYVYCYDGEDAFIGVKGQWRQLCPSDKAKDPVHSEIPHLPSEIDILSYDYARFEEIYSASFRSSPDLKYYGIHLRPAVFAWQW